MEWLIAILASLCYWIGFFIAYFVLFKPYDNSFGGWIKDLLVSLIWFITIPLKYIIEKLS